MPVAIGSAIDYVLALYGIYTDYRQDLAIDKIRELILLHHQEHERMMRALEAYLQQQLIAHEFSDLQTDAENAAGHLADSLTKPSDEAIRILDQLVYHTPDGMTHCEKLVSKILDKQNMLRSVEDSLAATTALMLGFLTLISAATVRLDSLRKQPGAHVPERDEAKETFLSNADRAMKCLRQRSDARFKAKASATGEPYFGGRMLVFGYTFKGEFYDDFGQGYPGRKYDAVWKRVNAAMAVHQAKVFPDFTGVKEMSQMIETVSRDVEQAPQHVPRALGLEPAPVGHA